jgi:hypothetical protein
MHGFYFDLDLRRLDSFIYSKNPVFLDDVSACISNSEELFLRLFCIYSFCDLILIFLN